MLTEEEKKFVTWWEANRLKEKKLFKQWLIGLPAGLLIGIPLLINFFSGWYKRADMEAHAQLSNGGFNPLILIIAVFLIVSFMAIFSKRHRWEMNEQKFRELKSKS
jgi:integral membrane sensor domain MASE1